jgi:hypothetical protein
VRCRNHGLSPVTKPAHEAGEGESDQNDDEKIHGMPVDDLITDCRAPCSRTGDTSGSRENNSASAQCAIRAAQTIAGSATAKVFVQLSRRE